MTRIAVFAAPIAFLLAADREASKGAGVIFVDQKRLPPSFHRLGTTPGPFHRISFALRRWKESSASDPEYGVPVGCPLLHGGGMLYLFARVRLRAVGKVILSNSYRATVMHVVAHRYCA
jgi:hypothetical protein